MSFLRKRQLFTLLMLTGMLSACFEGNNDSTPRDQHLPVASKSQEVSEVPTLGRTRQNLVKSVSKRLGRSVCDPRVFKRISMDGVRYYVNQINFGDKETKDKILDFISENQSSIIPLLGQIKDENQSENSADRNFIQSLPQSPQGKLTSFNVLHLVYEPGIKGAIPPEMGCKDGVSFELSRLKIPLRAEDLDQSEPAPNQNRPNSESNPLRGELDELAVAERFALTDPSALRGNSLPDPDDDDDPPSSPTACSFAMGNDGPCCHCTKGWTGDDGCDQTYACPHNNCCQSNDDLFCGSLDGTVWTNPGLLNTLGVGEHL